MHNKNNKNNTDVKRSTQLGMNPSTASHRLLKDILFEFVSKQGSKCFRCGKDLTRKTFSIEHKEPWLDSSDPIGKFFDLNNIAYSHLRCNSSCARKPAKLSAEVKREKERIRWHSKNRASQRRERRSKKE